MKLINKIPVIISIVFGMALVGCNKEKIENPDVEEQELITTIKLKVSNDNGFDKTFTYKVENGFGISSPGTITKDDVVLSANTDYKMEIQLLNEKKDPAEDITEEVIAEKNDHLFLYSIDNGIISFSNGDKDENGEPFNQTIHLKTGNAGTGNLTVTLKHEPANKNAATVADAGGETDVEATFLVNVQ